MKSTISNKTKNILKTTKAIFTDRSDGVFTTQKIIALNEGEMSPNSFNRKANRTALIANAVLFVFLALFSLSGEARAAEYVVNSDADIGDASEGNGICDIDLVTPGEQCTLRAALTESNYLAGVDFISFALPLLSVIHLSGNYGKMEIYDTVSINGPGARGLTIERDGSAGQNFRLFQISGLNTTANINGVSLVNGYADNYNGGLDGCTQRGGAICIQGGTLNLVGVTIRNNTAKNGGGISVESGGKLYVTRSTINNNKSLNAQGGGISSSGTTEISNSTVSGNSATDTVGSSGGIYSGGGELLLTNVTVSNNTAVAAGGGIDRFAGNLTVCNTIIAGNTAASNPGCFRHSHFAGKQFNRYFGGR